MQPDYYGEVRFFGKYDPDDPSIALNFPGLQQPVLIHKGDDKKEQLIVEMPEGVASEGMAALGLLVSAWGELEKTLHHCFETLLGVGYAPAASISYDYSGLGLTKLVERQLQLFKITEEESATHEKLINRVRKKNTVRNRALHSSWRPIVSFSRKDGELTAIVTFAREYIPPEPSGRRALSENEQKQVAAYSYDVGRLNAEAYAISELAAELQSFYEGLKLQSRFQLGRGETS